MNRIVASPSRRHPRGVNEATARFDLRGRLVSASAAFVVMLEERYLVEEILALPRALALRNACGGGQQPGQAIRRFSHRGNVYRLDAVYTAPSAASETALWLTIGEEGAVAPPRRRGWSTHAVSHRCAVLRSRPRPCAGASA